MAESAPPLPWAWRLTRAAIRGALCGAAVLLGVSSLLGAWTGDAAIWTSPLVVGGRAWGLLMGLGWLLVAGHLVRPMGPRPRWLLAALLLLFCLSAASDVLTYFSLVEAGTIATTRAVPASAAMLVLGALALFAALRDGPGPRGGLEWSAGLVSGAAGALGVVLVVMLSFAATDYRRPADCIIVLGAGVAADGTPSLSLRDRVAEGVELVDAGFADWLVMSGGIDPDHGQSEPRAMLRLAVEAGVPADRILLDEAGANTRASARSCATLLRQRGWQRALVVSHGYHLLRAKSAFRREGVEVYTVPATETRRLVREPYYVLRECAAWLFYALPS